MTGPVWIVSCSFTFTEHASIIYCEIFSIIHVFTWKGHHGRIVLAVGHTGAVRYTIHPQVGVVVDCGEYSITYLREIPVLGRQSRTDQDPTRNTTQKTTNFYIHHRRATHFAGFMLQSKSFFQENPA